MSMTLPDFFISFVFFVFVVHANPFPTFQHDVQSRKKLVNCEGLWSRDFVADRTLFCVIDLDPQGELAPRLTVGLRLMGGYRVGGIIVSGCPCCSFVKGNGKDANMIRRIIRKNRIENRRRLI